MIVVMNSRSEHESIEIDEPKDMEVISLDFNGHYLIECEYQNGEFTPTGNGINGGGFPLSNVFYEHLFISVIKCKHK